MASRLKMCAYGGLTLRRRNDLPAPEGLGEVTIASIDGGVRAIVKNSALRADGHVFSLLLTDSDGAPLPMYYTQNTVVKAAADGTLSEVALTFEPDEAVEGEATVRLMVDTYPAFTATVKF